MKTILFQTGLLALSIGMAHADVMKLQDFELSALPRNKAGDPYPDQYTGEGGRAALSLAPGSGLLNTSLNVDQTSGALYVQFNAHNSGGTRGFAREYVASPMDWKFNHYNRMSFWMKNPVNGAPLDLKGDPGLQFGTYVKRVTNADPYSDETGGNHYYHIVNVPNTGTWTRVVLNTHPNHRRGDNGNVEPGDQLRATKESGYNYFDALTRFYVNETEMEASGTTIKYQLDQFEFYREEAPENDVQVYTIAATYVPAQNRYILTWNRHKDQNDVKHEVRWARKSVHEIGWDAATPAPSGVVTPPGWQGYNNMVYQTTAIQGIGDIWFAIRPQGASTFSQIHLPSITPIPTALAPAPRMARAGAAIRAVDVLGRSVLAGPASDLDRKVADLAARGTGAGLLLLEASGQARPASAR